MFNKEKFAEILLKIQQQYESQEDFSKKSGVGRTYISSYINMKLEEPPKPKLLEKISDSSKGITVYKELLYICGYLSVADTLFFNYLNSCFETYSNKFKEIGLSTSQIHTIYLYFFDNNEEHITKIIYSLSKEEANIFANILNNLSISVQNHKNAVDSIIDGTLDSYYNKIELVQVYKNKNNILIPQNLIHHTNYEMDSKKEYFAYQSQDESMVPLLGINDIVIIEKTDKFSDNNTCLISLDNNTILIRKILDLKTHIELQPINYNFDTIKLTKEDMEKRNFQILGKVVKVENLSAFK